VVECITTIASQYFIGTDCLTVVIPMHVEDLKRTHFNFFPKKEIYNLLTELHVQEFFSLFVFRPSTLEQVTLKFYEYRKGTNYVIILRDPCSFVVKEILLALQSITLLPSWNSRAYFIVAVTTGDCGPRAKEVALNIIKELWKWKILNVIVVTPTSVPFRAQEINHIEEDDKAVPVLDLFTSPPLKPSVNHCTQLESVLLTEQWLISSHFLHNKHLFPPIVPNNLQGCPIKVSTIVYEPFVLEPEEITNNTNSTILHYKHGFEIRLLHLISTAVNVTLVFLPPPPYGQLWGKNYPNGTWTGIRGNVVNGKADVCLCGIVETDENSVVMDPTVTYWRGGFVWVVPCPKQFPRWLSVFRVFDFCAWMVIIATIVFASIVMWYLTRIPVNQIDARQTISANLCDAWAAILGISVPQMPRSLYIRAFFIFWVTYSLAVNTVFQAFLTSFLIDPGLLPPISNLDELLDSGIEYGYLDLMDRYLDPDNEKHRQVRSHRKVCSNTTACLERVAVRGDFGEFLSRQVVDYTSYYKFQDVNGIALICPFKDDFVQYNIAMYLIKGSPFVDRFNDIIAHAIQAGLLDKWYDDDIYSAKLRAHKRSVSSMDVEYAALSTTHFQGALFLYGIGNVFGLLMFVLEISYPYLTAAVHG